jgi:hypothetical protein
MPPKDVRTRLRNTERGFRVVDKREQADGVITVVARGIGTQQYGQRTSMFGYAGTYYGGAEMVSAPIVAETWWVSAVLEVPSAKYRRARDARDWIRANADRLRWAR